jgi:hypothetical protein
MIQLQLSIAEVNSILRSLGKAPFEEVADLITKIKQQGEPQATALMQAAQAAAPAAPETPAEEMLP